MTDESRVLISDQEEIITVKNTEEEPKAKGLDFGFLEQSSDVFEMIGSVLLDLQNDLRKEVINWATKLIIQETSDLLKTQRKLPRFESEKPKNDQYLDFDLDGTIENLFEDPIDKSNAVQVFNRARSGHSALLIIDTSFSMSGKKIVMAAAAAATICHLFDSRDIAVVYFSTKADVLKRFDVEMSPETLIEQIFSLIPKGLTNIYQGLKVALEELGERKQSKYTAILSSDCDINFGKIPSIISWKLQGLKIITIPPTVNDFIADTLAKETRGEVFHAEQVKDIPIILRKILSV